MSGLIKTTCPKCGYTSLTSANDDGSSKPCGKCGENFERKTQIELPPVQEEPVEIKQFSFKKTIEEKAPETISGNHGSRFGLGHSKDAHESSRTKPRGRGGCSCAQREWC